MRFAPATKNLWKLLVDMWKLPQPSLILSVTGGPVSDNYTQKYLRSALIKLVSDTSKLFTVFTYLLLCVPKQGTTVKPRGNKGLAWRKR